MTTDTPRTDAVIQSPNSFFMVRVENLCRELERELNASQAERDEARKALILNLQTTGGMPWREWSAECAKETCRADENLERAEKAEAEVERLNEWKDNLISNLMELERWRTGIKVRCHDASITA